MHCNLEFRENHVIWHRGRQGARSVQWGERFDQFLGKNFAATEGSFGRDIHFVVPRRVRMRVYALLGFLLSLNLYVVRELVASLIMLTAVSAVVLIPLSVLFAVFKAGQGLARNERFRSVVMDNIIRFPSKDRQLDKLLQMAANQSRRPMIVTLDPQKAATRNGLILITATPRRAS